MANGDYQSGCFDIKTSSEPAVYTRVGCFRFKVFKGESSKAVYRQLQTIVEGEKVETINSKHTVTDSPLASKLSEDLFVNFSNVHLN